MEISDKLIKQQNMIIDSNDKKMIIKAGPGSGKTYTIINKATKELLFFEKNFINKGIILCSFTKEASTELEKKLKTKTQNNFSFVGTIDSLILTVIIDPFKNRILKRINLENNLIEKKLKVFFPSLKDKTLTNITKTGFTKENINKINEYFNKWIIELNKGIYVLSFPAYLFAAKALKITPELKKYINNNFHALYIDEAQDLNEFQLYFIKSLLTNTNINCYLVGDENQSIYSFRGSNPRLFTSMKNLGFNEYEISYSARCHEHILEFANKIIKNIDSNKLDNLQKVIINFPIVNNLSYLKDLTDTFILTYTQQDALEIYNKCLKFNINNIIYTKRLIIESNTFYADNYFDVIEEIIKFYYNHNNPIAKLSYSIDELLNFLYVFLGNSIMKKRKLMINKDESVIDYLKKIFLLGELLLPKSLESELREKFELGNETILYKNFYTKQEGINRIMTIHASKGLEASNVFIQLTRDSYIVDDEKKRLIFVAITRAKEKVFMGFQGERNSDLENYISKIYNNTFYDN